jgi:hypothetical protein
VPAIFGPFQLHDHEVRLLSIASRSMRRRESSQSPNSSAITSTSGANDGCLVAQEPLKVTPFTKSVRRECRGREFNEAVGSDLENCHRQIASASAPDQNQQACDERKRRHQNVGNRNGEGAREARQDKPNCQEQHSGASRDCDCHVGPPTNEHQSYRRLRPDSRLRAPASNRDAYTVGIDILVYAMAAEGPWRWRDVCSSG